MSTRFEKKPRCAKGTCNSVPFVAKSGETFQKCDKCDNLVYDPQRKKCGHSETETVISQSEANKGREYNRCKSCNQFIGWVAAPGAPTASAAGPAYVTREEFDRLVQAVTALAARVLPVAETAAGQAAAETGSSQAPALPSGPPPKRARNE